MHPGELEIDERRAGGTVTLALAGELDLRTEPQLGAAVAGARGAQRMVLDLRRLRFVDSTGVQAILRADAAAREGGFDLVIVRGPRAVARVFALLELDDQLTVVDEDLGDASEAAA